MLRTYDFNMDMLRHTSSLKAYAISLCGNVDRAEDLVQETLLRAIANKDSFTPGTNMAAWLFTILRNHFRSEYRKRRREIEDADGNYAATLICKPEQYANLKLAEFKKALESLPPDQREALILVGARGFSYVEAARICECAVGTIKSRVNRARARMAEISDDFADDFGVASDFSWGPMGVARAPVRAVLPLATRTASPVRSIPPKAQATRPAAFASAQNGAHRDRITNVGSGLARALDLHGLKVTLVSRRALRGRPVSIYSVGAAHA